MNLGELLATILERHGFALPSGSGVAASELAAVAEEFLRAAREVEASGAKQTPSEDSDGTEPSRLSE